MTGICESELKCEGVFSVSNMREFCENSKKFKDVGVINPEKNNIEEFTNFKCIKWHVITHNYIANIVIKLVSALWMSYNCVKVGC